MAHATRLTREFLTDDENYRVDAQGNLTTDEKILVQQEDLSAFIEWLTSEFQRATGNDG